MSTAGIDDELWSAIGDPTRRRMLDLLLVEGGGTATTLGHRLPVTRQAVAKHLAVLDRVGLVHATQTGREKRYQVDEAQLARAVAQLSSVGAAWDARLRRIKDIAEAIQQARNGSENQPAPNGTEDQQTADGTAKQQTVNGSGKQQASDSAEGHQDQQAQHGIEDGKER